MDISPYDGGHVRMKLGALVLGVLPRADEQAVREHLSRCPQCAAELADLADMPSWLDLLTEGEAAATRPDAAEGMAGFPDGPPTGDGPDTAEVRRLVRDLADRRRRSRRARVLAVAASAVAVAASLAWGVTGRVTGGAAFGAAPEASIGTAADENLIAQGTTADGRVHASVAMTPEPWGTQLAATVTGTANGMRCQLVAVGRDGSQAVAASWTSQPTVNLVGGVPLSFNQISRFIVMTTDGSPILTVPVS